MISKQEYLAIKIWFVYYIFIFVDHGHPRDVNKLNICGVHKKKKIKPFY